METTYYDGTELLSQRDINGATPEIILCTTNRSGGKTTYFSRLLVNKFKRGQGKFMLIYRYRYEISECAEKFFKDIGQLFFPGERMTSKPMGKGLYHELFLNDQSCGYAVALNSAEQLKKYSHFFNDTERMMFDEFQSENNRYCPNELNKFRSIHASVARGNGKQSRYVPVYMLSNNVTLLNPYYTKFGIGARLNYNTRFLRGNGWVLENGFVDTAAKAQQESAFNRAFGDDSYNRYISQNVYMNDNVAFIGKPEGKAVYLLTVRFNEKDYSIKEYRGSGYLYCDDVVDLSFPNRVAINADDHMVNYRLLNRTDGMMKILRDYFEQGCFRFKNIACKEAVLNMLSY